MKKLTSKAQQKVVGGAGISGALFGGIGAMISSIGNMFATIIGSIVNAIHSFTDPTHLKAEYKYGSSSLNYDDTKQIDLEKELLKHENDHHLVKTKPMVTEQRISLDHFENESGLDLNVSSLNLEPNDGIVEDELIHEFY